MPAGRGGRPRALAVLLAATLAPMLVRQLSRPPAPLAGPVAGVEDDGVVRVYALAAARSLAAERAASCSRPPARLEAGEVLAATACVLERRGLRLGSARVLGAPVDLNRLTAADFEELRGIGPQLASRIVAHRRARGGFGTVEDLRAVRGVGPARLDQLRSALNPIEP